MARYDVHLERQLCRHAMVVMIPDTVHPRGLLECKRWWGDLEWTRIHGIRFRPRIYLSFVPRKIWKAVQCYARSH